ncbi:glucan biosynthesis glucosyltransferase H, partial [Klebsiella pneumoniae]|nr:glucan biosynthesis glucosyltransferase H [Klebsiella pneumoniae]
TAKNAILMPIHNEDAAAVFSRLRAMDKSLADVGASAAFDFFIISDTREASIALAEQAAFARFRSKASSKAFYRLRKVNTGRKAGNVADWVRN